MIEVKNLSTHFVTATGIARAVDDVSFTVPKGRIVGLVGESGSGKSVTGFSILNMIDEPGQIVGGKVLLNGVNLLALPYEELRGIRGNAISMIFQDPMTALNPVLKIGTQLVETIKSHDAEVSTEAARIRSRDILGKVGIPSPGERLEAYPHQLSGGMRQRVAIAAAMINNPAVIIADEPTTALDVTIQAQILYELKRVVDENNVSVLWISHDLSVVAGLVDEVVVMYAGKVMEAGPIDDILDRPLHPYTKGLLGALPARGGRRRKLEQIPGMIPSPYDLPPGCVFSARCPKVSEACSKPPPLSISEAGRMVSCFHPSVAKERV